MQEQFAINTAQYLASIKKSLLSPSNTKSLFFYLLTYFEIKKLKKFPDFEQLKKSFISLNVTTKEIFKVAVEAIGDKKLHTLKFLIDECGYDLKETADSNGITLLHVACEYGVTGIVQYLLEKGFNPNTEDHEQNTPLHRVVKTESYSPLIPLLIEYGANLNTKNAEGLTPLFEATVFQNLSACSELIKSGADKKIQCLGLNYLEFKVQVDKAAIEAREAGLSMVKLSPPKKDQEDISGKAIAKYYEGCLSLNFNLKIFQEAKAWLVKGREPLKKNECRYLISSIILTSKNFQPKIVFDELSRLIKSGKLTTYFAVLGLLRTSLFFVEQQQVDVVSKFNEFILSKLNDEDKISDKELLDSYRFLSIFYKRIGLLQKSEACLKQAVLKFSTQKADEYRMEIFFDLGCIQKFLMKEEEALESFENAFNLCRGKKGDFLSYLEHYVCFLLQFQRYEKALEICQQADIGEYSKIFTAYIYTLTGRSTWLNLLKIVDSTFLSNSAKIIALDIKANCYINLGDCAKALDVFQQNFTFTEQCFEENSDIDIATRMSKILHICLDLGEYQMGLNWAESFEKKYPLEFGYSVLCNSAVAVLCLLTQQFSKAKFLIEKISVSGADPEFLSSVYLSLISEILSSNNANYDMAMECINLVLNIDPNNFKGQFYKFLIAVLTKDQKTTEDTLQSIKPALLTDVSVVKDLLKEKTPTPLQNTATDIPDISTTSETDNKQEEESSFILEEQISSEITEYDPIKIHEFFKAEKARLLDETIPLLSSNPKPKTKWKVGSECFEEDNLTRIQHPLFFRCYAVIPSDFNPPFREKFEKALSKSDYHQMALSKKTNKMSRKCSNSVQTLNYSIVQLKIKGNNRLWTDKIYHVDGKYLFVFDRHDYHTVVRRKAQKGTEIKVIDLSEKPLSYSTTGRFKSGVFSTSPEEIRSVGNPSVSTTNTLRM